MPQARPLAYDFESACKRWQEERSRGRSRGRHLSEILKRLMKRIDPERFSGGGLDYALFQGGFIWEDTNSMILGQQLGSGQIETEKDGILMTLDDFDAERWRVIEYKSTKISSKNPIRSSSFYHWHVQIGCYCLTLDTLEAELVVRFDNGGYELGGGRFGKTVGKKWLLIFTKRELREYWTMILRERDRMDEEGA